MANRIANYADAFSLIGANNTIQLRDFVKNLEKDGHTEKSICFAIWKQQDKLRANIGSTGFLWLLKNEILKYSWAKDDIRWKNYNDKKEEQKKAATLLRHNRQEFIKGLRKPIEEVKKQGYIYFIQGQCGGAIKIGFSYDPAKRLVALQTGYPDTLTILHVIPGDVKKERLIQEEFTYCRLNGEWFKPDKQLIERIEKSKSKIKQA